MNELTPQEGQPLSAPRHRQRPRTGDHVRPRASQAKEEAKRITPEFFLSVFRQWWKVVIPAGLILASVAIGFILYSHVNEYDASALIVIHANPPYIAFGREGQAQATRGARYAQTQVELLRSPIVLDPVLSRPEIAAYAEFKDQVDPQQFLAGNLSVARIGGSELYRVRFRSSSPAHAAAVANAVIAEYLSIQSEEDSHVTQRVIDLLEVERNRRSLDVERLRKRFLELAKEVTGKSPFSNESLSDSVQTFIPGASLYQGLTQIEVDQAVLKAQAQALRGAPLLAPDDSAASDLLDLAIDNHPSIREQEGLLVAIRSRMGEIKKLSVQGEAHASYVDLLNILKEEQAKLADRKKALREEMQSQRMQERQQALEQIDAEFVILGAKKSVLSNRLDKQVVERKTGGSKSVQFEFARAELAREEQVFELIAARKLALQTELRAPAQVRLRKKANVPTTPIEPIPYKKMLIAALAALACPFGLAVARELTVRRIHDVAQLAQESNLRVLGEVARFPVRPTVVTPRALPRHVQREMFIFAESIDSVRTNLVLSGSLKNKDVLVVASAVSGEGKTSVATSLTVSIAGATKESTLIVDADLRAPDVARILNVPSSPGLAEVLEGKCTLVEALHPLGKHNTFVLPAGRISENPHHVVQDKPINELLDKLREKFEYIVVDTPPILNASESLVWARAADVVLYSSLCEFSRSSQVRLAVERLEIAQANVAGSVLCGTRIGRYKATYDYYSNYFSDPTSA